MIGDGRALALAYHAVAPAWRDPLCVTPETFARQLRTLAARGFRGTTLAEIARDGARGRRVAITFDDAFASAADWALPVLDDLGWPATVFVPTEPVTHRQPMRWLLEDRWRAEADPHLVPMTWLQVETLADKGWEIGSHSRTHPRLSALDESALEAELADSRRAIVDHVGRCESISYPWGEVDARVVSRARRAGYSAGSGLGGRFRARDPMAVPRVAIGSADARLRYGLKTSEAVWFVRGTPLWSAAEALRRLVP